MPTIVSRRDRSSIALGTFIGVPLARTGRWDAQSGRAEITLSMLEELVANFAAYSANGGPVSVPAKLGHSSPGNLLPAGMPAAGYIRDLWLQHGEGDDATLYGSIETVSETISELILSGAYDAVSVEIRGSLSIGDEDVGPILVSLALLGAEPPAVKGLDPLSKLADIYLPDAAKERLGIAASADEDAQVLTMAAFDAKAFRLTAPTQGEGALALDGDQNMKSATIKGALGLKPSASETEVIAAITKLQQGAEPEAKPEGEGDEKPEAVEPEGDEKAEEGDEAKPEGDAALAARVADLERRETLRQGEALKASIEATVDAAVGVRILPASRDDFIALGVKAGAETLKATLKRMPELDDLTSEMGFAGRRRSIIASTSSDEEITLSAEEKDMAAAMGLSEFDLINGERLARGLKPIEAPKA